MRKTILNRALPLVDAEEIIPRHQFLGGGQSAPTAKSLPVGGADGVVVALTLAEQDRPLRRRRHDRRRHYLVRPPRVPGERDPDYAAAEIEIFDPDTLPKGSIPVTKARLVCPSCHAETTYEEQKEIAKRQKQMGTRIL